MTSEPRQDGEPEQDGKPARRKFDDVASLYRPIVTGVGASGAFPPHRPAFIPMPPTYTAPVRRPESEALQTPPQIERDGPPNEELATARTATAPQLPVENRIQLAPPRMDPPPAARSQPTEIPWPDAFAPRPNYRKREGRNWSWLLLLPAGLVAAAAITMVDARSIRTWIDTAILHRTPIAGTLDSPLLPRAFRPGQTDAAGTATPPPEEANPYPALPTSPPPNSQSSVAPSAPTPAPNPAEAVAPTPIHVAIQFRRNIPGADGEARRIAALLQSYGGSIELHPNVTTVRAATINYYNAADKDAAAALAVVLGNEASSWLVRLGTAKNPPGTLDVWLP